MPDLIYEKRDGIALLTMNRPEKRNALSPQIMVQLADAWTDGTLDLLSELLSSGLELHGAPGAAWQ